MALEFGKDDLEYIKGTLEWLNQHTVLINDNRHNCETEHSRTQNSLIAIERGLAQCSDENAALPLQNVRQSAFGVYPDSVGFDLANENTLMAVFRTEEQANKFGRMMWGAMYYVEQIESQHFD